jgi:hypothetical protein
MSSSPIVLRDDVEVVDPRSLGDSRALVRGEAATGDLDRSRGLG